MAVLFTGVAQDFCLHLMRLLSDNSGVRHVNASELLENPASWKGSKHIVWFYRAPWSLSFVEDSPQACRSADEHLEQWLKTHRRLLRARRALGSRLVLVNADRADVAALLQSLGLVADRDVAGAQRLVRKSTTGLLPQCFESVFAQHWDVFEALEAMAGHSTAVGHGAEDRNSLSAEEIVDLFQRLLDAQRLPGLQRSLDAACTQVRQQGEELSALRSKLEAYVGAASRNATCLQAHEALVAEKGKLEEEVESLRVKLKSQSGQFEQSLKALEKACTESKDRCTNVENQRAALAAELGQVQAARKQESDAVLAEKASLQSSIKQLEDRLKHLQEDKDLLQVQLHQVQEELEKYFFLNRELQGAVEKTEQQARQTDMELQRLQSKDIDDEAQAERQQFAEASAAMEQAVAKEQARVKELQHESELMLMQMHQVQEDLERYFAENRQLKSHVLQSRESQDRARMLISRLVCAGSLDLQAGTFVAVQ